jgi:hypothetical protein
MQESAEPPVRKPIAGEAQCDPANPAHSENQNSAPQNVVPANFVEIYEIPKPDSPHKEEPTAEEIEEGMGEEPEDEPEDRATSPGQQITGEGIPYQQDQGAPTKEPLLSENIYAEIRKAGDRGDLAKASELAFEYSRQRRAEEEAEKAKERAAAEQQAMCENSADQQHEDDEEEFAKKEQPEPQPDQRFTIKMGGNPAKTAGLEMKDFIRQGDEIKEARYVSPEDGVINQFCERFDLPWDLRSLYEPLFESLILPTGVQGFGTTRQLFDDISALLQKHIVLPSKECSLLAYWAIATWFTDCLTFVPNVVISGPASTADLLLRTLVAVCRRPVLLGELSPTILRKLPINDIEPTLLVREPQLNRYMSALLNASNQPGYLFFSGKTFQQLYCPKCIYVGEFCKDTAATSNSVHINLSGGRLKLHRSPPTRDEITSFQNRLFSYRLLNHAEVASKDYDFSGFRPEIGAMVGVLIAAIVDDKELRQGIIEVLKDHDEESRVERATGVNGLVLQAVLFHCHQKDQQKFVRDIAATTNRLYAEDGESLKVSNETVGRILKSLGLYSHRLGNAGRGLVFDKATQSHAHRLGQGYEVLTVEPTCTYCHELQQLQS